MGLDDGPQSGGLIDIHFFKPIIIVLVLIGLLMFSLNVTQSFNRQHPKWHPGNHCDALCHHNYTKYDTGKENFQCLDTNCNKYICLCNGTNITTRWTRI
jgi:hypothetical protein